MAPKYDFISEITPSKETWSLKVRIVRVWTVTDYKTENLPFSLEMVLMDAKGDKIQATVRRYFMYRFQSDLKEGSVYTMANFKVDPTGGPYRSTRHPYKLSFKFGTKIKLATNDALPVNVFSFTPVNEIFQKDFDANLLMLLGFWLSDGMSKSLDVVVEIGSDSSDTDNATLSKDTADCMPQKRDHPVEETDLANSGTGKVLKRDIKIEKE